MNLFSKNQNNKTVIPNSSRNINIQKPKKTSIRPDLSDAERQRYINEGIINIHGCVVKPDLVPRGQVEPGTKIYLAEENPCEFRFPITKPSLNLKGYPQVEIVSTKYTSKHSTGFKEPVDITGEILINGEKHQYRANQNNFAIVPKVSKDILDSYNLRITLADEIERTLIVNFRDYLSSEDMLEKTSKYRNNFDGTFDERPVYLDKTNDPENVSFYLELGSNKASYTGSYNYTTDTLEWFYNCYEMESLDKDVIDYDTIFIKYHTNEIYPRQCVMDYVKEITRERCKENELTFLKKAERDKIRKARNFTAYDTLDF